MAAEDRTACAVPLPRVGAEGRKPSGPSRNVLSKSSAMVSISALGLPPTAIAFNFGVLVFRHLAKSAVTDSLNVVNSAWPKMAALMSAAGTRSWQ